MMNGLVILALFTAICSAVHFVSSSLFTSSRNKRCANRGVDVDCAGHVGVVYSMNHGPFRTLLKPLVVRPRQHAVVAVCNIPDSVPTLVSKVGASASVVVFVQNSGNLRVPAGQRIVISEPLLHPLISGVIGERAEVAIHIMDSGNVLLGEGASLSIESGTALVTTPLHTNAIRSSDCIEFTVRGTANVIGKSAVHVQLGANARLIDSVVDTRLANNANMDIIVQEAGAIHGVSSIKLDPGALLVSSLVRIEKACQKTTMTVYEHNAANLATSNEVFMDSRSSLIAGVVELGAGTENVVKIVLEKSANAMVQRTKMGNSTRLMSFIVRSKGAVRVHSNLSDSANIRCHLQGIVHASNRAKLIGQPLIVGYATGNVRLRKMGNSFVGGLGNGHLFEVRKSGHVRFDAHDVGSSIPCSLATVNVKQEE